MLRQYNSQRFRYEAIVAGNIVRHVRVGTVPVGTIFRSVDMHSSRDRKLMVECWHPREVGAGRCVEGRYQTTFAAGGHLATVRDLSNGRRFQLSDHYILFAVDND